jgi:hypothetical protein
MITLLKADVIHSTTEEIKPKPARFLMGLDLGQMSDYSAFSIIEERGAAYHVRHLQRWPLRTPYTAIASDVARISHSTELAGEVRHMLAVDMNGVGAPFLDILKTHNVAADVEPVFSHGGDKVVRDGGVWRVPKRLLVAQTQIALEQGRLKIAPGLPEAPTLVKELQNYQVEIDPLTAHDSYGAWRTGTHDDLLFAVMLPLFIATAPRRNMAFA